MFCLKTGELCLKMGAGLEGEAHGHGAVGGGGAPICFLARGGLSHGMRLGVSQLAGGVGRATELCRKGFGTSRHPDSAQINQAASEGRQNPSLCPAFLPEPPLLLTFLRSPGPQAGGLGLKPACGVGMCSRGGGAQRGGVIPMLSRWGDVNSAAVTMAAAVAGGRATRRHRR